MGKPEEEDTVKDEKKSSKPNDKKSQPNVLILFKVKEDSPWAIYPRLFRDEETALTKLEQSYPFEEHSFQVCTFK